MEKIDLENLKEQAQKEISNAQNLDELNQVLKSYLGKKSQVSLILKTLKDAPSNERAQLGKDINEAKRFIQADFAKRKQELKNIGPSKTKDEWFDVSAPGHKKEIGHLHPLTLAKREIMLIFETMGFEIAEGPEVETEWYNFDALNIPANHPARDMWDTFWLKEPKSSKLQASALPASRSNSKLLLRTHTSPVQIRYMEKNQPPIKIIAPGKTFRHEATDATHEAQFYQLEGLMVGKDISVANFKAVIQTFLERFFRRQTKIRLRPSFFPFTEPSFEVDMTCAFCGGKGCRVCEGTGWVELMGAGMAHPKVLENAGVDSKKNQGFAFGVGIERLVMMKEKINEIRLFHSGDLRFLQQF